MPTSISTSSAADVDDRLSPKPPSTLGCGRAVGEAGLGGAGLPGAVTNESSASSSSSSSTGIGLIWKEMKNVM